MAGKIFINYRRDDAIGTAGRLHDRLAQTFGRDNLFMDVDHIPAGVDFAEYLHSQVAACDVFLAVIGPNWLDAKDDSGRRRFDNPDDFVTIEIAAALARNIRVIPVLVDGARTPKADKLPDSVRPLVRRNAVELRNTQFGRDAEALASKVREALTVARPARAPWPFLASAAAWLMVPGRWRTVAGTATALLLVGWIGLYQVGVPLWVPWAEQPDPARADKTKAAADAEAQRKAAEAEQQRLAAIKEEEQRQAKAADLEAKLKAAEAEQQRLREEAQRQAKAAADAEAKRRAAEAEQQRLKEEQQRQAQAAADAEAKRKAAEAEQQRLAAVRAEEERKAKSEAEAAARRKAEEAEQQRAAALRPEQAPSDAEKACDARAVDVNAKPLIGMARISFIRKCVSDAEAARSALLPQSAQQFAKAPFEIRTNVEAISPYARGPSPQSGTSAYWSSLESAMSTGECETICARSPACKIFSYSKNWQVCYMYSNATLAPNSNFDSGIRR